MTSPTLTDEQIIEIADRTRTAESRDGDYILPISFARAILAASPTAPPDTLKQALEAHKTSLSVLCALEHANDWHSNMQKDITFAIDGTRAAIASLRVAAPPDTTGRVEVGAVPVDMILYCPNCGAQHVDAPDNLVPIVHQQSGTVVDEQWTNPPHKSHLCHGCGCIWRPADAPTNGVSELKTQGKADTWKVQPGAMSGAFPVSDLRSPASSVGGVGSGETIPVRFDILYAFAQAHRLDFNALCRTVRDAIAEGSAPASPAPAGQTKEDELRQALQAANANAAGWKRRAQAAGQSEPVATVTLGDTGAVRAWRWIGKATLKPGSMHYLYAAPALVQGDGPVPGVPLADIAVAITPGAAQELAASVQGDGTVGGVAGSKQRKTRDVAGILHFLTQQQMAEEIVRLDAVIAAQPAPAALGDGGKR